LVLEPMVVAKRKLPDSFINTQTTYNKREKKTGT
jgi:hypothetical protein